MSQPIRHGQKKPIYRKEHKPSFCKFNGKKISLLLNGALQVAVTITGIALIIFFPPAFIAGVTLLSVGALTGGLTIFLSTLKERRPNIKVKKPLPEKKSSESAKVTKSSSKKSCPPKKRVVNPPLPLITITPPTPPILLKETPHATTHKGLGNVQEKTIVDAKNHLQKTPSSKKTRPLSFTQKDLMTRRGTLKKITPRKRTPIKTETDKLYELVVQRRKAMSSSSSKSSYKSGWSEDV